MRSRYVVMAALALVLSATVSARAGADALHFKNGSVLNNVAVLSEDWRGVQVQVSDTVRMTFPRELVDRIERERATPVPGRPAHTGQLVPASLREKLAQSIAVNYEKPANFVEILANISELYGIDIAVDPRVKAKIADDSIDPMWTFTKEDGTKLSQMLEKLVRDKRLKYDFANGSIVIRTQEQAAATAVLPPPRAAPAIRLPTLPTGTRPGAPALRLPVAPAGRRPGAPGIRPSTGPGARPGAPTGRGMPRMPQMPQMPGLPGGLPRRPPGR